MSVCGSIPRERAEYLTRACEGDAELREEVESLIEAYEEDGDVLETAARSRRPTR